MQAAELIAHEKEQSSKLTKENIKSKAYEASAIAQNIYQQNNDKDTTEILEMIKDALRPIRYQDGNGYFFITDLNGTEILFADRPEIEGRNLLGLQDTQGRYVIKDMIEIIKQNGEGFYTYHWTKPGAEKNNFEKISFIKYLENLNCFVGTGLYITDIESKIKKNLLAAMSRIRFGKEGYIFVNKFNGEALVSNGKQFSGTQKLWEVFNKNPEKMKRIFDKEYHASQKPEGGYILYSHVKLTTPDIETPKTSFIFGIPDLQWLIGAGVYLDEVEAEISLMQEILIKRIKTKISYSLLITLGIILFLIPLFHKLNRNFTNDINMFLSFFNKWISSDEPINRDLIQFREFDQMAQSINTMFLERNQAQKKLLDEQTALRQSEEKYRNTMDSVQIGVYIIQDFIFQYVNPAMTTIFGYNAEEMIGKMSPLDLIEAEQHRQIKKDLIRKASGELKYANDIKCVRRNGDLFDAMVIGTPTIHQGKMASVGTIIDITERKAAETELKKSENRATALLKAVPDMVFRTNAQGVFLDVKADVNNLFGTPPGHFIGKDTYEVLPHNLATLIEEKMQVTLQSGKTHTFEFQLSIPDRGMVDYEARMVKSGKNEVTSIVRNITERKEVLEKQKILEKQLNQSKRMESIGLMAGGVAHDLNNILSGIVGYPELILQQTPEDSPFRPHIDAIQGAGMRAAAIVDDLLTVARGAASTREPHNLNSLIMEYLNSLECTKIQSLHPQISIVHQLHARRADISCSQVHIKKCLMNLVTNGVEAVADSGTVIISTRNQFIDAAAGAKHDITKGEYIVLGIRDNGPGIAQQDLEHIFEPFYSKKRMGRSGTGLGLTVVWNSVQDHKGQIRVESSEEGTSFELYFPLNDSTANVQDKKETVTTHFTGNGEHILIVDDESLLRKIGREMLQSLGYRVDTVASGEAAIEFIKTTQVDLLLLDMLMEPGINGYQTYKEIINIYPGQKAIIISGYSENKNIEAALELGASDFIKKPYTMEQLSRAVYTTLHT